MPDIYHIVHVDRLQSILDAGLIFSDKMIRELALSGTDIGMSHIKERRLRKKLNSHPDLSVGACTPFYFCPRSIMLYIYNCQNHPQLNYKGGQEPIIHLKSDLEDTVAWANRNSRKWAFTNSNASSDYFEDFNDLSHLDQINWSAVQANEWSVSSIKEAKQAEFLIEESFPWSLVQEIGVYSNDYKLQLEEIFIRSSLLNNLSVGVKREWYY